MSRKRTLRWWYIRKAEQLKATQVEIMEEVEKKKAAKQAAKQAREERKERRPKIRVLKAEEDPYFVDYSSQQSPSVSNNWSESRLGEDLAAELEHELQQERSVPEHVNIPLKKSSKDKRLISHEDLTGCQLVTEPAQEPQLLIQEDQKEEKVVSEAEIDDVVEEAERELASVV